jgi:PleD family two-component response regulator
VSSWQAEEPPEKFLRRADQALYLAKQQGRNRVMEESQLLSEQAGAK